jgi:hypothetical protein
VAESSGGHQLEIIVTLVPRAGELLLVELSFLNDLGPVMLTSWSLDSESDKSQHTAAPDT